MRRAALITSALLIRSQRGGATETPTAPLISNEGGDDGLSRRSLPAALGSGARVMAVTASGDADQVRPAQAFSPFPCTISRTQPAFFSSIMRWMIGVRISSMAKPILPPFTTIEVGLDMKESWIMSSR